MNSIDGSIQVDGDKTTMTKTVLSLLSDAGRNDISNDYAMRSWWVTPPNKPGMRLSPEGFEVFQDILECYIFDSDDCLSRPRNLILLDKKMLCPYFIRRRPGQKFQLMIFGSQQAMMATLYGDVQNFLDSLIR